MMRRFIKNLLKGGADVYELEQEVQQLRHDLADAKAQLPARPSSPNTSVRDALLTDDFQRDSLALLLGARPPIADDIVISTEFPIAVSSDDHRYPRGTMADNTRHPRFVAACERLFGRKVHHLDLGCAGGGLVWDFLINGHLSVGIEGSDYSRVERRAEWRTIPSHLFTADITKPFRLSRAGAPLRFDVITAWEVLEHIPEPAIDGLIGNIAAHLSPDGLFVASVAMFEDKDPTTGAVWHVTLKPAAWWEERFRSKDLVPQPSPFHHRDYVRGNGNPRAIWDWNAETDPEMGFHLVARLSHPRFGRRSE